MAAVSIASSLSVAFVLSGLLIIHCTRLSINSVLSAALLDVVVGLGAMQAVWSSVRIHSDSAS
jgi:hypothetical protein